MLMIFFFLIASFRSHFFACLGGRGGGGGGSSSSAISASKYTERTPGMNTIRGQNIFSRSLSVLVMVNQPSLVCCRIEP